MKKLITGLLAGLAAMVFVLPVFAADAGARAAAGDAPVPPDGIVLADASPSDTPEDEDTGTDTTTPTPVPTADPTPSDEVPPPPGGNGWRYYEGNDYFFKNGKYVTNYWAGQSNGGSKWNLWYYLGPDGKMWKGFHYIEDDTGTGWYMLEEGDGDTRGQMLTGWQNTGVAGRGWFNTARGAVHGMCTKTDGWGAYNAATGLWTDGLSHR